MWFSRQHGFVQTVLTGNMRYAAETELRVAGLDSHLRLDLGAYGSDSRDRLELHAVVADRYLDQFGSPLPISQTEVVGDAPNDIYCARLAGLQVVVVTHRMERDELLEHSPDAILDSLAPGSVVPAVQALTGTAH